MPPPSSRKKGSQVAPGAKARKKKPPPPRPEITTDNSLNQTPRRAQATGDTARKTPKRQPGPVSNAERRQATRFKRTRKYRGAVRDAYDTRSEEDRRARQQRVIDRLIKADRGTAASERAGESRQLSARTLDELGPEDLALLKLHDDRLDRNDVLAEGRARSTGMSDAERNRADRFTSSTPYKTIMDTLRRENREEKSAGLDLLGAAKDVGKFAAAGGVLSFPKKVVGNLGRAAIEDPKAVAKSSARTAVESVAGIPQGLVMLATQPGKALEAMGKDYVDRYKPLITGHDDEFRENIKKRYGVTPYVLDASAAASGGGTVAGGIARSGVALRAASRLNRSDAPVARGAGRVLSAATETATRQRPNLRFSGGERGVRAQRTSRNLLVAAGQRGVDARRGAKYQKRLRKANLKETGDGRLVRADPSRPAGRLDAVRPGQNEVVGRALRDRPGLRRLTGTVERDIGKVKGVTRLALLGERGRANREMDKALRKLTEDELAALKPTIDLGLPGDNLAAAVRALETRAAAIRREREAVEGNGDAAVPEVIRDTNDELQLIERILEDPARHITPRLREAADDLIAVQRRTEAADPDLPADRAKIRRLHPQAALLGVRREPDVESMLRRLDELDDDARGRGVQLDGRLRDVYARVATAHPEDRPAIMREAEQAAAGAVRALETSRPVRTIRQSVDEARDMAELDAMIRRDDRLRARARSTPRASENAERLDKIRALMTDERTPLAERIAAATRLSHLTEQRIPEGLLPTRKRGESLAKYRKRVGDDIIEAARSRPIDVDADAGRGSKKILRDAEQALAAAMRPATDPLDMARRIGQEVRKKDTMRLEDAVKYEARVTKAAEDAGLKEPGYWASTARPRTDFSDAAVGTGGRGIAGSKRYTGSLHRLGAETHTPDAFVRGVERNIKRRFSWALVTRNMDAHAFEWSRGAKGEGMTARELLDEIDHRQIHADDVAFINARVVERREPDQAGVDRGDVTDGLPDDEILRDVHDESRETPRVDIEREAGELQGQAINRYLAVPRRVYDELQAATTPDSGVSRMAEIVLRAKPARILLGLNPGWLMFGIASNIFITGIATNIRGPFDVYGAHKFWKGLSEEQRLALEPHLGIGYHPIIDQPHLGSTAQNSGFVNAYRGFKQTKVGKVAHYANAPSRIMDLMFAADRAQNNFFRKVLFYDSARRAARDSMGRGWHRMDKLQGEMTKMLELDPEQLGPAIPAHGRVIEQHAEAVNKFLGDYTTFTAAERRMFQRTVMFYGYTRFSLRLALWTLPVEHPVVANIFSNLGRLGAQETKDLLGVDPEDWVPTSIVGRMFWGKGEDQNSINLGRMNPGMNSILSLDPKNPQQMVGMVGPMWQALADQMLGQSTYSGDVWRTGGKPAPFGDAPATYYGAEERGRILMRDMLSLAAPYRAAEKVMLEGSQGDDSLLWDPREIEYSKKETRQKIRAQDRKEAETPLWQRVTASMTGVLPTHDPSADILKREREEEQALEDYKHGRKKPKKRKRRTGWGSSSYGGGGVPSGGQGWGNYRPKSSSGWQWGDG